MHVFTWPFSFTDWYFGHIFYVFPLSEGMQRIFLFDAAVYKRAVLHADVTNTYFKEKKTGKVIEHL